LLVKAKFAINLVNNRIVFDAANPASIQSDETGDPLSTNRERCNNLLACRWYSKIQLKVC